MIFFNALMTGFMHEMNCFGSRTRNLNGGIGSLFDPCVNAVGRPVILTVTYGGELLYLRIWRDHSARSAHNIVAACFTA